MGQPPPATVTTHGISNRPTSTVHDAVDDESVRRSHDDVTRDGAAGDGGPGGRGQNGIDGLLHPGARVGVNRAGARRSLQASLPRCSELPSVFTAVQEQLGLRLVSSRAPVEVLVIKFTGRATPD